MEGLKPWHRPMTQMTLATNIKENIKGKPKRPKGI
jgi:hypothetical protein